MPRSRGAPAPARSASAAASRPKPAASSPPPAAPSHSHQAHSQQTQAQPQSSGGWFSRPAAPSPPPMAAPPSAAPPAVASSGGGMMSGLLGTVVQGAALGTGSAVAHRAVDAMMGPRTVVHEHQGAPPAPAVPIAASTMAPPTAEGPCGGQVKAFAECMSKHNGDMGVCQWYFDSMQQCRLSSGSA